MWNKTELEKTYESRITQIAEETVKNLDKMEGLHSQNLLPNYSEVE